MPLNFIETKNKNYFTRRELLIGFSAILAVAISFIFPIKAIGESFWTIFFLYAIFPVVVIRFLLKEPIAAFGISGGRQKQGIILSALFTAIFILACYYLVFHSTLAGQIPIVRSITASFANFLLFEFFIAFPLHFFSEFFFRGFIQLGLENKFGIFSLILPALLQTLFVFRGSWIMILLVVFSSLAAGIIVRQSRSIVYSFVFMWLISISLDIMLIRVITRG